jgi:hypothetical protein
VKHTTAISIPLSGADLKALAAQAATLGVTPEKYAASLILDAVRGSPVTIVEVAKAAGVSSMTVSCAINNRPGVSPQNKRRILAIVEKMGYRPNLGAQAMRKRVTEARRAARTSATIKP